MGAWFFFPGPRHKNGTRPQERKGWDIEQEWSALFRGKAFITDLGAEQQAQVSGETVTVGRYAVWTPDGEGHRIIEVGADLERLRLTHKVGMENVCVLVRR